MYLKKTWLAASLLFLGGTVTLGAVGGSDDAAGEAVIDGFIEILKNKDSNFQQRRRACWGLAKRGVKAKRALPDATKFLYEQLDRAERVKNKLLLGLEFQSLAAVVDTIPKIGANNQQALDALVLPLKKSQSREVRATVSQGIALFADVSDKAFKAKAGIELQVVSEADVDPLVRRIARLGLTVAQGPRLADVELRLPAPGPNATKKDKRVDSSIKLPKAPQKVELMWGNRAPVGEPAQIEVIQDGDTVFITARASSPDSIEEIGCLPGTYFVIVTDEDNKTGYLRVNVTDSDR